MVSVIIFHHYIAPCRISYFRNAKWTRKSLWSCGPFWIPLFLISFCYITTNTISLWYHLLPHYIYNCQLRRKVSLTWLLFSQVTRNFITITRIKLKKYFIFKVIKGIMYNWNKKLATFCQLNTSSRTTASSVAA